MSEIYVALVSGSMALFGVALSSFITYCVTKQQNAEEKKRHIRERKEELYVKLLMKIDIMAREEKIPSFGGKRDEMGKMLQQMEAMMQLYASKDVIKMYRQFMKYYEEDIAYEATQCALELLVKAMRGDLGIGEGNFKLKMKGTRTKNKSPRTCFCKS